MKRCPNHHITTGFKFCTVCGEELVKIVLNCPGCGEPIVDTQKFCGECGVALKAEF